MMIKKGVNIIKGDCLKVMDKMIEKGVKVDAIITDPPYGTTACKWDSIIPFEAMWERLNKVIKLNGAIVLFGSEPFSSALRMSNIKNYKYDWVWDKVKGTGFLNANRQPMRNHELIHLFYKKQCLYNPQKTTGHKNKKSIRRVGHQAGETYGKTNKDNIYESTERYPRSIQVFSSDTQNSSLHPTQKPVKLLEYLIKTYTNENEIVLDFTMGSGTTGVACVNTRRRFIGVEKDEKYYDIAKERLLNEIQ
jgi:site-specific DNA-methyltransferase (adenine-specific)